MNLMFKNFSNQRSSFQFYGKGYFFGPFQTKVIKVESPIDISSINTMHANIRFVGIKYDEEVQMQIGLYKNHSVGSENILLIFGPYDEFHVFNRFNLRINELKNSNPNHKVIAVVPETAACIINNADEVLCFSDEKLRQTGSNYPNVLEKMGTMERYDFGFGVSNFMQEAIQFVNRRYSDSKIKIVLYTNDHQFSRKEYMPAEFEIFRGNGYNSDLIFWIFNDFDLIRDSILQGYSILPFQEDYDRMLAKYSNFFDKRNTFIFLTRNFKNKQPHLFNSNQDHFLMIKKVLEEGYAVVNIGFPCVKTGIQHPNYFEIEENLTYSETISLFYLSKGVFLRADAGGFSTHACVNTNLFLLTEEWEKKDLLYDARKQRTDYETFKVNLTNLKECIQKAVQIKINKKTVNKNSLFLIDKIDKFSLKNIIKSQTGKEALIVALGPSINDKNIEKLAKDKILISCNLWFRHFRIQPNYWVFANPTLNMQVLSNKILSIIKNNSKTSIVYADSVDLTDKSFIETFSEKNGIKFFTYDQRHFGGNRCQTGVFYQKGKNCCDNIIPGRLTIQEELQKQTGYNKNYSSGDTVAVHMITLAVLLGCKKISVIGMDLDYTGGYAKVLPEDNVNDLSLEMYMPPSPRILDDCRINIYNDINIIIESARKLDTCIEIL